MKSARRLVRRKDREKSGRFLAEGLQAVSEALTAGANISLLLVTAEAVSRYPALTAEATELGIDCRGVTDRDLASIAQAVHPAGIVAVCDKVDVGLEAVLRPDAQLIVCGVEVRDPGNAGTVIRCADAAGADAVVFSSASVDLYNPKAVRASTGSIFHLPIATGADPGELVGRCRDGGLQVLAAGGAGEVGLDELDSGGGLCRPTLWLFGNEAHGLDAGRTGLADQHVRVPIYGRAESLNLATAAAVCLYASAFALRSAGPAADASPG